MTEKTPYIRYDHNLYSNDNFLLEEVQNSANLNLVPLDIEHPSLSPNASSSFEFRPSRIFSVVLMQDEMFLGLGMSYVKMLSKEMRIGYTVDIHLITTMR